MNLGAFAVVIAVARRTGSAEIDTYAGLGKTGPGLAITLTIFLFSLAGIPPFAGWFAKFVMFRAVLDANSPSAVMLGVIAALGSVVAFFYYAGVARKMWFHDPAPEAAGHTEADPRRAHRGHRPLRRRHRRGGRLPADRRPHRRARLPDLTAPPSVLASLDGDIAPSLTPERWVR